MGELKDRLACFEKEHDRVMGVVERFKGAPRALEKKQVELQEVEKLIASTEQQIIDLSEIAQQHLTDLADLREAIEGARKGGSKDGSLRAKAEAVRKLIERIDVEFEPTGKSYPQSVPIFIDVIPVAGSKVRYAVSD